MKKMSRGKKAAVIIAVIFIVLIAADGILSVVIYDANFNQRFVTYEPTVLKLSDFEGLERKQYHFESDRGDMITGYLYSKEGDKRGIVVIAHGFGGGGHNSYMDCADLFASNGYYVFAYDATACDESEGKGVGGLAQGTADLDYAISFVENCDEIPDLPIVLFGHSWGGYSVCSVLTYHPEVKAVVECSGFCSSSDMFEAEGKRQAGDFIYAMMPFVKMYESVKCGKYASNNALDGFAASDVPVMVVHSEDDNVVPIEYGYDRYYEKYGSDPRFEFVRYENKGHNYVFNDQEYINSFNEGYNKWRDSLDYDISAEENKERYMTEKAEYFYENLDRQKYTHSLDTELFDRILTFYDESIEK